MHGVPASPHCVPSAAWFAPHEPEPLQVSGLSQADDEPSPHAIPDGTKPLSWHAPPRHVSWLMHWVPASPHCVPSAAWFEAHEPEPLHVSGLSHDDVEPSPHAVPEGWKPLS